MVSKQNRVLCANMQWVVAITWNKYIMIVILHLFCGFMFNKRTKYFVFCGYLFFRIFLTITPMSSKRSVKIIRILFVLSLLVKITF